MLWRKGLDVNLLSISCDHVVVTAKGVSVNLLSMSCDHVVVTAKGVSVPEDWHFIGVCDYLSNRLVKDLERH